MGDPVVDLRTVPRVMQRRGVSVGGERRHRHIPAAPLGYRLMLKRQKMGE